MRTIALPTPRDLEAISSACGLLAAYKPKKRPATLRRLASLGRLRGLSDDTRTAIWHLRWLVLQDGSLLAYVTAQTILASANTDGSS